MSDIQNNNIAEEEITEQDINILKKVRLEKLNELKAVSYTHLTLPTTERG